MKWNESWGSIEVRYSIFSFRFLCFRREFYFAAGVGVSPACRNRFLRSGVETLSWQFVEIVWWVGYISELRCQRGLQRGVEV